MKKYAILLIVFMLGTIAGEIITYNITDNDSKQHDIQLENACIDLLYTIWSTNPDYALDVLTETDEYLTLDSLLGSRHISVSNAPDVVSTKLKVDKPTKHFYYD